ncbi:MAG: serine hydrolase, partial [Caldilineaceae bacterium]
KDNKYGKQWSIRHNMSSAEYQSQVDLLKAQGLWPYVIDIHGTTASPRYAAIWYKDTAVAARHDRSLTAFTQDIADQAAAGRRPVWVSALGNPANEEPLFAGIWVKDAYTGTMRINLTADDIGAEGLARSLTDQGFRMVNLSAYETSEGIRYAGVWIKGGPCPDLRWEGFRDQTSSALQIKASAQRQVSAVKSLAAGTITLGANDLSGGYRTARVAITHNFPPPEPDLAIIATNPANLAQNGDILVLQAQPGKNLIVRQLVNGNIRLRNIDPNNASVGGQPFVFGNHTHRLVLQYSAASQKWVELQRNGLSPDYYFATSLDEYGPANGRRYNSVWQAGPSQRRWAVTGRPAGSDPLAILDVVMQEYMQRRNLPNAVLAISRNGAPVFARGYSWDLPGVAAAPPGLPMRLASVSKPLTAIAILRLVQNNQLNLDT